MNNSSIARARRFPVTRLALLISLNSVCLFSPSSQADDTPVAPVDEAATTLGTVSVIGQGETRQVQRVTQKDVEAYSAGTSPLKVLQRLPGDKVLVGDML